MYGMGYGMGYGGGYGMPMMRPHYNNFRSFDSDGGFGYGGYGMHPGGYFG
ncbi:hypothetical protein SNEBB_011301, partial [Seison nebaliae]